MATIVRNGYGQLELNRVAFRRDGRVEAQVPYDVSTDGQVYENGMVVIIETTAAGKVAKVGTIEDGDLYGIVYTSEELYDSRKPGLKNFGVVVEDGKAKGPEGYDVYPRIGFLSAGDVFTTNTVVKTDDFAMGDTVKVAATGEWTKVTAAGEDEGEGAGTGAGPIGVVNQVYTMPDGQPAIEIEIKKA